MLTVILTLILFLFLQCVQKQQNFKNRYKDSIEYEQLFEGKELQCHIFQKHT